MRSRTRKPVNVNCELKPGESTDKLIKRFLKKCKKEEIIKEHLEKTVFRTPSQKRRWKRAKNKHLRQKDLRKNEKYQNN